MNLTKDVEITKVIKSKVTDKQEEKKANRKKQYKCLYNHELLILSTTQTPYQTYDENIKKEQVEGYVKELEGTQVDALMCCPTAWRRNLWHSETDPHWQEEAPFLKEPLPEHDWKYYEKAYYRMRRYMLAGGDPVGESLKAAREAGIDFFISYRMNDHHYLNCPDSPTHGTFWNRHPEYRINLDKKSAEDMKKNNRLAPFVSPSTAGMFLNYLVPQVRDYYYSLLEELVRMYDVDGIELDFQRSPLFFSPEKLNEGTAVMTGFVNRIRTMLDEYEKTRGKEMQLSVRVPHTIEICNIAGLNIAEWDEKELVDIINVSPYFRHTLEIDMEGFRQIVKNARIYGEMHFITAPGRTPSGFTNNINRKTSKEIYETTAYHFLERGADGISLFNFAYTRDHHFNEPRRLDYPGKEPPFGILGHICDREYLAKRPKHYYIGSGFGSLPKTDNAQISLQIFDDVKNDLFKRAVLRIECIQACRSVKLCVTLNGTRLTETEESGELFAPFSIEALPPAEHVRYYEVPLAVMNKGMNEIRLENSSATKAVTFTGVELALYTV